MGSRIGLEVNRLFPPGEVPPFTVPPGEVPPFEVTLGVEPPFVVPPFVEPPFVRGVVGPCASVGLPCVAETLS